MTLAAENLNHTYLKGTPLQRLALSAVSLEVHPGECVAVVGASGSGKSTLARILAGLVVPTSGRVLLHGREVTAIPVVGLWKSRVGAMRRAATHALATNPVRYFERRHWSVSRTPSLRTKTATTIHRPIMLAFQNPEDQFFTTSVFEEVGVGLAPTPATPVRVNAESYGFVERLLAMMVRNDVVARPQTGMANPAIRTAVLYAMQLVDLDPDIYGGRDPFTLSGGEQRRLALAVLLARNPRVLVLDEPSAGLDGPGRQRLYACMERLRHEQKTSVVLVSHDLEEVAAVADRVIVLNGGRVAAQGDTDEVLQDAETLIAAGLAPQPLVRLRAVLAERGYALAGNWKDAAGAAAALKPALIAAADTRSEGRA